MIIGVVNKITGQAEGSYPSKTLRRKEPYLDESIYHIFEIPQGKYLEAYSWNNGLVEDVNYVPYKNSPEFLVKQSIEGAIKFGQAMLVDFATENVLLGITQLGKTKEVSDYLADVTRYIQTGSLYEVINEIDRLIAAGLPVELEPFITESRLLLFKQKIVDYLSWES